MKQYGFLTLSIAEAKPGADDFEVNCAELQPQTMLAKSICSFRLSKDKIFDDQGNPKWDIGKVTLLEHDAVYAPKTKPENRIFMTVGEVKMRTEKDVPLPVFRNFLEVNKIEYEQFERDKTIPFAVVKARKLVSIEAGKEEKKFRKQNLYVDFDDDHRNVALLNKDYRWVHYWRQIPDDQSWGKQEHYQDMLNEPGKALYLIIRRYVFEHSTRYWISGMHWL